MIVIVVGFLCLKIIKNIVENIIIFVEHQLGDGVKRLNLLTKWKRLKPCAVGGREVNARETN